jgi:guanidinopropionase
MREAQCMVHAVSGLNFIGGDMVEVALPFDPSGTTALNSATIAFEMLCLFSEQIVV